MSTEKRKIKLFLTSPDDQELIAEYLASLDCEILAQQDEDWLQADIFIFDVQSASQMGPEVLKLKQSSDAFLPVIIVLGKDDDIDVWLSAGFDDCLRKPFTKSELRAHMEILLHLRQQSEELIREGEAKYRAIFEATGTATLIVEEDTTIIMANKTCLSVTGYSPKELIGTKWTKYVAPESLEMMLRYYKLRREDPEKAPSQYEVKLVNKAGEVRRAILQVSMVAGFKHSVVSMLDITERKMVEIGLNQQREILQKIFDHIPVMIAYFDERGNIKTVNHELVKKLGWSLEEWKTENILAKCYPEPEALKEATDFMINKPTGWKDFKTSTKSGTVIDTAWTNTLLSDGVSMGIGLDITERKMAEDALGERERQFSILISNLPGMAYRCLNDKNWTMLFVSDGCYKLTGYLPEDLINNKKIAFNDLILEQYQTYLWGKWQKLLEAKLPLEEEYQIRTASGEIKWVWEKGRGIFNENRELLFLEGYIQDITERKKMEEALKESEESYRRLFEDHSAVKLVLDPDSGDIIDANKAAADFYGWSREELKRMKIQQINILPPDEIKIELEKARTLEKTYFEFRHRLADGSIRDVKVFSSKIEIKGKDYLHPIIHDITKEKELESQLYQSQKLESIGQLAGGVAHDFNNMLNVILGYGELVLNKLHQGDPMREEVRQIVEAGRRSMSLTEQLLAFSRKQILQPKILNINESLKAIEGMLRRLIGEDIELTLALAEDLSYVKADQGQIEQIIMNLAVNARDAMPYGGKLIIETANVALDESYAQNHAGTVPGDYVMLAATDTGRGMDRETLSRIFEPFFTTKGKKGTGLGLATVYGIVKQSGGNIFVYSEPEKGTTFKIYIPATLAKAQLEEKQTEKDAGHKGGREHILIVEDELALRGLFEAMLTELGYRVTVAANGGEALLLVEEKGLKPDLVITDVIMPIMSGAVLVERLRRNQPDIKVLFMSGYTDNAIVHHGVLDAGTPFIQKPFNVKDLAAKIERLLKSHN